MKKVLLSFAFILFITVNIFGKPNPPADEVSYKALFIGISEYSNSDWPSLKYAASDAESFKSLMESKYGFTETKILTNDQATKANISKSVADLANNASEDDHILIFFSGHGLEIDNEGYWAPYEAASKNSSALLSNTQLKDLIRKSRSKHILILSDGCFSGTAFKSPSFFVNNDGTPSYYKKIDMLISRQALTSGGMTPDYDEDAENSVFTKYILKHLQNNETEILDAGELYELVKYAIFSNSPNMPRLGHIQNTGHEGGQFIFKISASNTKVDNSPKADLVEKPDDTKANNSIVAEKPVEVEKCNLAVTIKEGKAITFKGIDKGTLTASSNDGTVSYQWFFQDKMLGETGNQLIVSETGNYQVIAYKSATCQSTTAINVVFEVKEEAEVANIGNVEVFIQEGNKLEVTSKGTLTAKTFTKLNVEYEWQLDGVKMGSSPELTVFRTGNYRINLLYNGEVIASDYSAVIVKPRTYTTTSGDNLEKITLLFYKDKKYESLVLNANPGLIDANGTVTQGSTLKIPAKEQLEQNQAVLGSLKLVGANDFSPFSSPDSYKDGLVTDIVKTVFDKIGQGYSVEYYPTNAHVGGLRFNKFAAAFPAQKQPSNRDYFHFSKPVYTITHVLFSRAEEPFDWSIEKNIKGKVIGLVNGYSIKELDDYASRKYVKIQPCKTLAQAFSLLKSGDIDLVACATLNAYDAFASYDYLNQSDFYMVSTPINRADLYFAVSKQNPYAREIIYSFNKTFDALDNEGIITKIIDEHIDEFQKRP